jgi:threonine/homoserine/homoserine lactone efflux protein
MTAYITAIIFLVITPGPGVLTTAGVGSAYGFQAGLAYMFGIIFGSLIAMSAVGSGLAAIVFSVPYIRDILLFASLSYLLYLAFRIATSGARIAFIETNKPLGFMNGLTLSVINPKAYAVGTTIFSGFPILPNNSVAEFTLKIIILASISIPVHFIWLYAGASLKKLGLRGSTMSIINILMALSMLSVVSLALYSSGI